MSARRCRPGDLAVTVGYDRAYPEHSGLLVDVLYAAPVGQFRLPDGGGALNDDTCVAWVIRLHQLIRVPLFGGGYRMASYACCNDKSLQPIRGQQQPESTTVQADQPQTVEV